MDPPLIKILRIPRLQEVLVPVFHKEKHNYGIYHIYDLTINYGKGKVFVILCKEFVEVLEGSCRKFVVRIDFCMGSSTLTTTRDK